MSEARMDALLDDAPYLLTRSAAAYHYSLSERELDRLYRSHPEFPIIRKGRRVLIHREGADAFFTRYIGDDIGE